MYVQFVLLFKVLLEDVEMLKIKPDSLTYTSDYFYKMMDMCENGMLKKGLAYVDDTDGDLMRLEREQRVESKNRYNCEFEIFYNFKPS